MPTLPHDSYAQAVTNHLTTSNHTPDETSTWTDDGHAMTAVWRWNNYQQPRHNPTVWPHGLVLAWFSDQGWGYSPGRRLGGYEERVLLGLHLYASPESVTKAVAELLTGNKNTPVSGEQWEHADELHAVLPKAGLITEKARLELLTRLKTAHRTRMGRRGELGPVVAALHLTADLMDAEDRERERGAWQHYMVSRHTRRPRPPFGWPQDPGQLMHWGGGFLAAYGLDARDPKEQWQQVRSAYTAPGGAGHQAWKAWLLECRAVHAEMGKLLVPSGLDSPDLTAANVRAIADRLATEVMTAATLDA